MPATNSHLLRAFIVAVWGEKREQLAGRITAPVMSPIGWDVTPKQDGSVSRAAIRIHLDLRQVSE
jgi:hypothetical protein